MSTILITHDLGLAAAYCDRVVVMQKGHVVETAHSKAIFAAPSHAYTRKLMRATPRPGVTLRELLPEEALERRGAAPGRAGQAQRRLQRRPAQTASRCWSSRSSSRSTRARDSASSFAQQVCAAASRRRPSSPQAFRAVDGISFTVHRGESVGLVGESGCGKSTTSTMVMRLIDKSDGVISVRRPGHRRHSGQAVRAAAAAQAHPDGVPGPDRQPQPALHGGARHRRSDPAARRHPRRQGRARPLRGAGAAGRAAGRAARSLSAPAVRRPEGARRHRAGDRARTPTWSSSTSRPRRSTCRCRRWCSTCCRS